MHNGVVMDLALLGTGGMLPLPNRWLASALLRWDGRLILFDCGEGTQITLRALGWGVKGVDVVLISHVHGDHIGGIAGLLLSQGNAGRTEPVQVVGPPGMREVLEGLLVIAPHLPFDLEVAEVEDGSTFEIGALRVQSALMEHSVSSIAYRLDQARTPRFLADRAAALDVPRQAWGQLQRGQPVEIGGTMIAPADVLGPPRRGISVVLSADTRPNPRLVSLARGASLLLAEGTYGDPADGQKAVERKHMTFAEAAAVAAEAGVDHLLLSHFSPALVDPPSYADEALRVFPNTTVGHDHFTLSVGFPDDEAPPIT